MKNIILLLTLLTCLVNAQAQATAKWNVGVYNGIVDLYYKEPNTGIWKTISPLSESFKYYKRYNWTYIEANYMFPISNKLWTSAGIQYTYFRLIDSRGFSYSEKYTPITLKMQYIPILRHKVRLLIGASVKLFPSRSYYGLNVGLYYQIADRQGISLCFEGNVRPYLRRDLINNIYGFNLGYYFGTHKKWLEKHPK